MKKNLLPLIFGAVLLIIGFAANAAAVYGPGYCKDWSTAQDYLLCQQHSPYCCPSTYMYNRTRTKVIAAYQPYKPPMYSYLNMGVWRIANTPFSGVLTNNDYQDIEDAKAKTGGYWRWGACYNWSLYTFPSTYLCLE